MEALAGYRQLRHTLATELGIEPSAALRELELRMLRQDRALELAPAEPRRGAPARRPMRATSPKAHRLPVASNAIRWTTTRLSMRGQCVSALQAR